MSLFRTRTDKAPRRRGRRMQITAAGIGYFAMMLFLMLAALNTGSNLLYGVFGLMVGVLLLTSTLSIRVLRRLEVHRNLPDHGIVGLPATVVYTFKNTKRFWPSLAVSVLEQDAKEGFARPPQSYLLHAAPGSQVSVPTHVVPKRRGLHQLDRYRLETSFPFGLLRRSVMDRQPDRLLVYPAIGRVDRAVLSLCRTAETTGMHLRPRQGGQDEFYGVKEFRPGENPRHIYWKRSARTAGAGLLVAREMTHVAPPRLLLLVDTFLVDRDPVTVANVERGIAMAASLADMAIEADLSVGLITWSNGWKRIEPSTGKRQRVDLLSLLAQLPTNSTADTAALLAQSQRHTRTGTTAVLFTPRAANTARDTRGRVGLVTISAEDTQVTSWFTFDPSISFA